MTEEKVGAAADRAVGGIGVSDVWKEGFHFAKVRSISKWRG